MDAVFAIVVVRRLPQPQDSIGWWRPWSGGQKDSKPTPSPLEVSFPEIVAIRSSTQCFGDNYGVRVHMSFRWSCIRLQHLFRPTSLESEASASRAEAASTSCVCVYMHKITRPNANTAMICLLDLTANRGRSGSLLLEPRVV